MDSTERRFEYDPLSVMQWLGILLLLAIPLVNIILLFVWAFSDGTHPTKRNYARANLLLLAIVIAVCIAVGLSVALIHG